MNILVTGGNGFIGSHVCAKLRSLGHVPTVFDRHWSWGAYRCADSFLGDVSDADAVDQAIYHTDAVIHLAGVLGTQETVKNPFPAVETNVVGSLNVFESCAKHHKKAVYIAVGNHWMNNPYSITKTMAERFALMYNKERGTQIAIVRGLNAYGPGQKAGPVRKIMPNFIVPALKGEPLTVYGDGSQIMDMIYVEDLASILCAALLADHDVYQAVFEAGTGVRTTVIQIAREVLRQANPGRLTRHNAILHVAMRPGEPEGSAVVADVSTLKPLLYVPSIGLATGIARTIPYYREQLGMEAAS